MLNKMVKLLSVMGLIMLVGCSNAEPIKTTTDSSNCVYGIYDSKPYSCNGTTKSCLYGDTSLNTPCYCNGTDWVQMKNTSRIC